MKFNLVEHLKMLCEVANGEEPFADKAEAQYRLYVNEIFRKAKLDDENINEVLTFVSGLISDTPIFITRNVNDEEIGDFFDKHPCFSGFTGDSISKKDLIEFLSSFYQFRELYHPLQAR